MQGMRRRSLSMKAVAISLGLILSPAASTWAGTGHTPGKMTADGRFNTRCFAWGQDIHKELCQVSFIRLVSFPEKYDQRMISVTGFVIKSFGRVVLFPSRERYEAGINIEGVELMGELNMDKSLVGRLEEGVFPVMVTGTFDATYSGSDILRLGAITHIIGVRPVLQIPEK